MHERGEYASGGGPLARRQLVSTQHAGRRVVAVVGAARVSSIVVVVVVVIVVAAVVAVVVVVTVEGRSSAAVLLTTTRLILIVNAQTRSVFAARHGRVRHALLVVEVIGLLLLLLVPLSALVGRIGQEDAVQRRTGGVHRRPQRLLAHIGVGCLTKR